MDEAPLPFPPGALSVPAGSGRRGQGPTVGCERSVVSDVCGYVGMQVCSYVGMHACMRVCACVRTYVCMYVCMSMYVCMCMHVCMYVCM